MKLSFENILGAILLVATSASPIPAATTRHRSIDYKKRAPPVPPDSRPGLIYAPGGKCGSPRASAISYDTGGPNGQEMWLDCGVDTPTGWAPPPITLDNIIYKDLSEVLTQHNNPFEKCKPHLATFKQLAGTTGIPTILLASIALQESGCIWNTTGGAGEIGLMQVTSEKCPHGDIGQCYDPTTNIGIGANYLSDILQENNHNLAAALGSYNGWTVGMTEFDASNYRECARHNNLDYLQSVFNGYLQGVNPDGMGKFKNTCQARGSAQ